MALSIAITGASFTAITVPANAVVQVSTQSSANEVSKAELLQRINSYRAENSLSPVTLNTNLGNVAQEWSDKTATAGTFKHNPDFATQVTPGYSYVAEIIAAAETPEEAIYGWINSEGHNNILLEAKATEIGIGYAYQGNPSGEYFGNYYATAVFADYSKKNVIAFPPSFSETHFTIPNIEGVQYRNGQSIIPAGTYPGAGSVTIIAEPKAGYSLIGAYTWNHIFPELATIPTPVSPVEPIPAPAPAPVPAPTPTPAPAPIVEPFIDITPSSPFYKEISWLASQKITTGWADGTFRPHEPISRDAMAAFLYRFDQKNLRP